MIAAVVLLSLVPIVGLPRYGIVHPGVIGLCLIAVLAAVGVLPRRAFKVTLVDVGVLVVLTGLLISVAMGDQTVKT